MMTKVVFLFALFVCFTLAVEFDDADYAFTPHHRVHKNCVHRVESGTKISRSDEGFYTLFHPDGTVTSMPPCEHEPLFRSPMTHGRAWKAWTQYHNTTGFTFMSATWPAPPAPAQPSDSEILYYWPGTEPEDNSFVLQPVVRHYFFISVIILKWTVYLQLFNSCNMVQLQLVEVNIGQLQGMI